MDSAERGSTERWHGTMGKLSVPVGGTPQRHGDGDNAWITVEGAGRASALSRYTSPVTRGPATSGSGGLRPTDREGLTSHSRSCRRRTSLASQWSVSRSQLTRNSYNIGN